MIIAEIGSNHAGDLKLARKLMAEAQQAGADVAKFQLFTPENLYAEGENYIGLQSLQQATVKPEWLPHLFSYSEKIGLPIAFSVFDRESCWLLSKYSSKLPFVKIASMEALDFQLLGHAIALNRPLIVSTGGMRLSQVGKIAEFLTDRLISFSLAQCTAAYPCKPRDANLNVIKTFKDAFECSVGFSDHTIETIDAAKAAYLAGADFVEKHFKGNSDLGTPDSPHSLNFEDFKTYCGTFKRKEFVLESETQPCFQFMGSKRKNILDCELSTLKKAKRGVFYLKDLKKNSPLMPSAVASRRCDGKDCLGLEYLPLFIGRRLRADVVSGMPCKITDVVDSSP